MAIHDRDYMKRPASPSEFPEDSALENAPAAKPFDLFAGMPVEQLTLVEDGISRPSAPKAKKDDEKAPTSKPNYWMIVVIALLVGIVIGAALMY